MNAYELAKALKDYYEEVSEEFSGFGFLRESASLISQQANRIAELEKELKRTKFAWNLAENEIEKLSHPVKQLSVQRIEEIYTKEYLNVSNPLKFLSFASAIIKEITE